MPHIDRRRALPWLAPASFLGATFFAAPLWAHVKWFSSRFSYDMAPRQVSEILSPTFWAIAALSMITVGLLVVVDRPMRRAGWYRAIEAWFDERSPSAPTVMRVAAGIVLLLCWQGGVILAPELTTTSGWVGWLQLALVFSLFNARTTPIAGAGILALYLIGISQYGVLHMLDYFAFVGVGYYLLFHGVKLAPFSDLRKAALFATTGFSLCWLAMEKLFYPEWSLLLLQEHPQLALGLDPEFFLLGAAFLEFCLGYLLIVGLWGRPLAIVITLVFFLTTLVFGKQEVIGHAMLHGILIVFMLEGAEGALRPPILFHRRVPMRIAFGVVNLVVAFAVMMFPYRELAISRQARELSAAGAQGTPHLGDTHHGMAHHGGHHGMHHGGMHTSLFEVAGPDVPEVSLAAQEKADGGWSLTFGLRNVRFAPRGVGGLHRPGEAHVHLYVDGEVRGQFFAPTGELPPLGPGPHVLVAELGTNDHRVYAKDGVPIRATITVTTSVDGAGRGDDAGVNTAFTPDDLVFFEPLPARMDGDGPAPAEALIHLGRMLFYEPRLSKNHDVSCNSCHQLQRYGVDQDATSKGHKAQRGDRNSPTVYNAGLHVAQFWDGRAEDLEAQAKGPVLNPVEMAMARPEDVEKVLRSIPGYQSAFSAAFPRDKEPVTYDNMAIAIGAFERGLTTPGRFDAFLKGDTQALTQLEKEGLRTFVDLGCVSCHNGPAVGGRSFQRLGLVVPYEDLRDPGRFAVTGSEADRHLFKVPSLRNVAETWPYFHHGELEQLDDVVRTMAKHQLGKTLSDAQVNRLVAFLKSLTGELPEDYIREPVLPDSGPTTPRPDPS